MYNATGGLGGSGQVDSRVAANANVALLSTNAVFALFVVGPIFSILGPRLSWFLGALFRFSALLQSSVEVPEAPLNIIY